MFRNAQVVQCGKAAMLQAKNLLEIGVISGDDLTTEAAVTKLMILLGEKGVEKTKEVIGKSIAGEMSV